MTVKFSQNLGKKEIVNNIKSVIGFSHKHIQKVTDDIIDAIIEILIIEKKVNIKNFGSFTIVYKNKRAGRNPKTKEEFIIIPRNIVKFKASNYLKQSLNDI